MTTKQTYQKQAKQLSVKERWNWLMDHSQDLKVQLPDFSKMDIRNTANQIHELLERYNVPRHRSEL